MSFKQKLISGLGLLVLAMPLISGLLSPLVPKALADTAPAVTLANFKFISGSTITGDVNGQSVTFYDNNPLGDSIHNFAPQNLPSPLCNAPGQYFGVNLDSNPKLTDAKINGTVKLGYTTGNNCSEISANYYRPSNVVKIDNPNQVAATQYAWQDATTIVSVTGSETYTQATNPPNVFIDHAASGNGCDISGVIVTTNDNKGNLYRISYSLGNGSLGSVATYLSTDERKNCGLQSTDLNITIAGTPTNPVGGGTSSSGTGATGPSAPSCGSNFNSPFAYLICPILGVLDDAAGGFNNFIEGQLNFCTGVSSTTGAKCSDNNLTDQVKTGWSTFRVIATALLIIIMLVAIISQALGGQIFDAYAIRKILPKLVIAVILIQLSWFIFKFFIDLTNDIGHGIQSLMFAPFGGSGNMDLAKLIGHGIKVAGGGSAGADALAFTLFTTLAIGVIAVSVPGLLLLALYVVLALFIAFLTLILRKVLIIMLVLLSPLALIAWILPGTNRYWKLWSENFTKILVMFPMVMALIAAGRIFAYIAAGAPQASMFGIIHLGSLPIPYPADVQRLADLAIILVAFFAPYFLLPQTFKWGGHVMGALATGVQKKIHEPTMKRSQEYGGELKKRFRGNIAQRYEMTGQGWKAALKRGALRTAAGNPLPLRRQNLELLKKGAEYKQELVDAETARIFNSYKERLRDTGSVKEAKKYVMENFATSDDQYRRRAAYNFMLDTKSFLELDDPDVRVLKKGKDKGKDIYKTREWSDTLHASPERFAAVSQARPDWLPFELPIGGGPSGEDKDTAGAYIYHGTPAERETQADDARLTKVLKKMGVGDLQKVHSTLYKEINRLAQAGKTQSTEALAKMVDEAMSVQGGIGLHQLTPLMGGEESPRGPIDEAMEAIGHDTLTDLLTAGRAARAAGGVAAAGAAGAGAPPTGPPAAPATGTGPAAGGGFAPGVGTSDGLDAAAMSEAVARGVERAQSRAPRRPAPEDVLHVPHPPQPYDHDAVRPPDQNPPPTNP